MDCHGAGAMSQQMGQHVMHGHLPPEMMEDPFMDEQMGDDWTGDFVHEAPPAVVQAEVAARSEMMKQHENWGEQFEAEQMLHDFEMKDEAAAMLEEFKQLPPDEDDWAAQFEQMNEGEDWAEEFNNDDVQVFTAEGQDLIPYEQKMAESKFYDLMNKVRRGDLKIDEDRGMILPGVGHTDDWAGDFADTDNPEGPLAQQFLAQRAMVGDQIDSEDDEYREMWEMEEEEGIEELHRQWEAEEAMAGEAKLQEAWEENGEAMAADFLAAEKQANEEEAFAEEYMEAQKRQEEGEGWAEDYEGMNEDWLEEYKELTREMVRAQDIADYEFDPNNPYIFHDNPFDEGIQLQQAGSLSEAVLAFEAACQHDLTRGEAWVKLGIAQQENEKDLMAIRALNKAREILPKNTEVQMALAVSHTNESNHTLALQALRSWVLAHPEYEPLGSVQIEPPPTEDEEMFANEFLFVTPKEHRDVCTLFQGAIEMNPADADLYVGLGILQNLSHDFDEAAENFHQALKRRPDDPKLWNKLGATLANGNRSEESIDPYNRALDLNPGYVRAQFNLGVAYSNMGQHDVAAKQFVRAIVMQQGGVQTPDPPTRSTQEMWDSLRLTLGLMERPDLVEKSWNKDVTPLLSPLGLDDII